MLNGIAFDTTGSFGHRLLVSGSRKGGTKVVAIDCNGGVSSSTMIGLSTHHSSW
ncbi:MAG: hypothetical protein KGJ86_13525 [Chloroflexota bacterium]|nr:hypothetical protein [Chloroflexota bacterium]